jgi:hypothetical protein
MNEANEEMNKMAVLTFEALLNGKIGLNFLTLSHYQMYLFQGP